jgi:hypothetical protein
LPGNLIYFELALACMRLPEEEKAVLTHAIVSLQGGLSYQGPLSKLIDDVRGKVYKFYRSASAQVSTETDAETETKKPAPPSGELQERLKEVANAFEVLEENRRDLEGHAGKARSVVDMINKDIFD